MVSKLYFVGESQRNIIHCEILICLAGTMNKWKNHFSEMKGDVGMSLHEKEGEQEDGSTETQTH